MAVVQLRRTEIDRGPQMDADTFVIRRGEDGLTEIEIGSTEPEAKEAKVDNDFDRNLAEDMDDTARSALAAWLLESIQADEEARREWEDTVNFVASYLGIKLTDPQSTVAADGTVCQAVATCMLEASLKMWSTSYAELLPVGGPVKVERKDPVPANQPEAAGLAHNGGPPMESAEPAEPGQEPQTGADAAGDDLADALERDLNWYLTVNDKGYYPDFSKMLMNRNLIGMAFREVYRCPIERRPISRWVMAQDLIVSGSPSHLDEAGRVTSRKKVRQSVMRRMQASGHYIDTVLVHPTGIASQTELTIGETEGVSPMPSLPRDYEHTVYESFCELGSGTAHELYGDLRELDKDETGKDPGYPLPYRVSIDFDSRTVLAIRRNWKKGDTDHRRRRRFVSYRLIPSFGGGFYDWGLIHLVGNPTQAATMLQRSSVDAALFSNFPAWLTAQGPGSRMEQSVIRPTVGEMVKVPVSSGSKISDVFMPMPYKGASAEALALGQKLEADVKSIAGIVNLPVGEGRLGNTPVGTIMSYIESVSMVPGAVHKADHTAQGEEFELLRELIAEEPAVLTRGNRNPARQWQVAEEVLSPNLAPKADPNTPSQMHRLLKIQGQIAMGGLPQFAGIADNRAIYKRATEILAGEDAAEYTLPEAPAQPPPPDPKIVAAQIKADADKTKVEAGIQKDAMQHQERTQEIAQEGEQREADRESAETRAAMSMEGAKIKAGADAAEGHADRLHDAFGQSAQRALDHAHHTTEQMTAPLSGGLSATPDKGAGE